MSQVKSTRITVVKGKNLSINRRLAVITVACIAPTSGWGRGGSARAARPMYKSGLFQDGVIHLMIESDALQSNARNLQGSSRIQLTCFVRVLRRYVLPARERLLDYSLRCLGREQFPFLRRQIVHAKRLIRASIIPLPVLVIKAFGRFSHVTKYVNGRPPMSSDDTRIGGTLENRSEKVPVFLSIRTPVRRDLCQNAIIP